MSNAKKLGLALNHSVLFLCVSMYLGTGWSLVLFSFPVIPSLTVDNYYMQFVPQVTAATKFFTWMTSLMLVVGIIMVIAEWQTRFRWVPIVTLAAVVAATLLTMWVIIPLNKEMANHISDTSRLSEVLRKWAALNWVRVSLWTVQWLAMMYYFAAQFLTANHRRPVVVGKTAEAA